jgi:hypothetical protein
MDQLLENQTEPTKVPINPNDSLQSFSHKIPSPKPKSHLEQLTNPHTPKHSLPRRHVLPKLHPNPRPKRNP